MSSNSSYSLLIILSLLLLLILDSADLTVSSSCPGNCGEINIPYPFGIGSGCYLEKWYEIECVNSSSIPGERVPFLSVIRKEVVNISLPVPPYGGYSSLPAGSVRVKNPITSKGCSSHEEELGSLLNLTGTPFYVSGRNRLIAAGCNITASLTNVEPNMVGCKSSCGGAANHTASEDYIAELGCDDDDGYSSTNCNEAVITNENACNGFRCCQANIPARVQQIVGVRIDSTLNTRECKVAFLTDEAYSLTLSDGSDPKRLHAGGTATVELGWFIHTSNRRSYVDSLGCQSSKMYKQLYNQSYQSTYGISCVCDYNAYLSYARCACNLGYEGNPYLQGGGGCTDINECLEKEEDGP